MTNAEIEANISALKAHNMTALFERIADTYYDGLRIVRKDVAILIEARLVKYARGTAHLTGAGWSVSTRIAAYESTGAIAARGPGHWRAH